MADWFFDPSATGTGSGDSPANAATNFTSMWSYITSAWVQGDRLWMRRSSVATFAPTNVTTQYGFASWNSQSHAYSWVIGWPRSGDPFFSDRPGVARSAGWDTDANTVFSDINMVVFRDLGSGVHGFHNGMGVANALWVNDTGALRVPPVRVTSSPYVPKWNNHFLNYQFNTNIRAVREATLTTSLFSLGANAVDWSFDQLTLTASCVIGEIFNNNFNSSIKVLDIKTNSVLHWIGGNLSGNNPTPNYGNVHLVDTVVGQKPFMDVGSHGTNFRPVWQLRFDNYYGEGPYQVTARRTPRTSVARSGTALVNGALAFGMTQCTSGNVNPYNAPPVSGMYSGGHARHRAFITWTQSTMCRITWPFFQAGSGQLNPTSSGLIHHIHVLGSRVLEAQVVAGSGWTWSGGSTGTGSAWAATADWIPSVSGSGFIDLMLGALNQTNDEIMFFAQPQVNSQ